MLAKREAEQAGAATVLQHAHRRLQRHVAFDRRGDGKRALDLRRVRVPVLRARVEIGHDLSSAPTRATDVMPKIVAPMSRISARPARRKIAISASTVPIENFAW